MKPDPFHRKPLRLPGYDYSSPGAYFATLVIKDRVILFGDVEDGKMHDSNLGRLVFKEWHHLEKQFLTEGERNNIRLYIQSNSLSWKTDEEYITTHTGGL